MKITLPTKVALLSISLLLYSSVAIAPALPFLLASFRQSDPTITQANIEQLTTLPALGVVVFVLLSDWVVAILGKKTTTLLGLFLIGIGGVMPFWVNNFAAVLFWRLVLGAGIGLCDGLSVSLISAFFNDSQLAFMLGLRQSVFNLGKMLITALAGFGALIAAKAVFLVYLLAFLILGLVLFYVPTPSTPPTSPKQNAIPKLPLIVAAAANFCLGLTYTGTTNKLPFLLASYHAANTAGTNLLTLMAMMGALFGFGFKAIWARLHQLTFGVMMFLLGLANLLFLLPFSYLTFALAAGLSGISFVLAMAALFYFVSQTVTPAATHRATTIVLASGNLGALLMPAIVALLAKFVPLPSCQSPFIILGIIALLAAICCTWTMQSIHH